MMYDWLDHFWIGDSETNLIEVGNMLSTVRITPRKVKAKGRNVKGQLNKVSLDNIYENLDINCSNMLIADADTLQSAILNIDGLLYLKFFNTGRYHSENRTSQSVSQIKIRRTSRAFITIDKVVLASDPNGTNYGGTLDTETSIVTIAADLPSANSEVIVSYYYKGWRGDATINENSLVRDKRTGLWNFNFSIEGK